MKKLLCSLLLTLPLFSAAKLVCPPVNMVRQAKLDFLVGVPSPTSPMSKDYMVMGHITDNNVGWYVVDGLFAGITDENVALAKGQALLEIAHDPRGPYKGMSQVNFCVYHYSIFDSTDMRPKFIMTMNGTELKDPEQILNLYHQGSRLTFNT